MRRSARLSSVGLSESQDSADYFNTRYSVNTFLKKVRRLTVDQRKAIEQAGFGHLLEIPNQTLNKSLLVELMRRWDIEKHSVVLPCGEIRPNLKDVVVILGLRVIGAHIVFDDNAPFLNLETDFGGSLWKRNVTVASVESRLDSFSGICNDDFVRTFLLYTIGTFLFPNANDKVDTRYLSFLKNVDDIGSYAWGEAVLEHLIKWLDRRKEMDVKYVGGCLLFLQIWSFEHIDVARPVLLDSSVAFPRVCQWDTTKAHIRDHLNLKFKDLEHHQVTWDLQPTSWESNLDIIKELLEAESNETEPSEGETCSVNFQTITDVNTGTTMILANQEVIQVETESETSPIMESKRQLANKQVIQVETGSEASPIIGRKIQREIDLDSQSQIIPCCSTPIILSKKQNQLDLVAISNDSDPVIFIDDEEDLRSRIRILEDRNMELENENTKLRTENELLKSQQPSGLDLEENHNPESELEKYENLIFRLERVLLDEEANENIK